MRERRRRLAAEQPAQADLGGRGAEQVAPADDQVDSLAEVVDDDREPVRPVAVPVADGTGRRRYPPPRPSTARSGGPSTVRSRHPGRPAPPARPDHGRGTRPDSPARATGGRGRAPMPRTSTACSRSRRRGSPHGVAQARRHTDRRRRIAASGPRRRRTRATPGPPAGPPRRPVATGRDRGPRSEGGRGPPRHQPGPRRRSRSPRVRDGDGRSAPVRTASSAVARQSSRSGSDPGGETIVGPDRAARSRASSARVAAMRRR